MSRERAIEVPVAEPKIETTANPRTNAQPVFPLVLKEVLHAQCDNSGEFRDPCHLIDENYFP